jgi:hypothetical protein
MASVAAKFSFACPNCDKVLKTSARPAEGKKIKCSECGKAFVPEQDDDDEASIQEKPILKGKSKSAAKSSANGKATRPKVKSAKEKAGGSNMLLYGLIGAGALVLLLGCGGLGITAFVWPGFMRSKPDEQLAKNDASKNTDKNAADKGNNDAGKKDNDKNKGPGGNPVDQQPPAKNNNPAHFILADADVLIGTNIKALRDQGQLEKLLDKLDKNGLGVGGGNGEIEEAKDLFRNSEQMVMSVQIPTALFEDRPAKKSEGGFGQPPGGPIQPGGQIPPGIQIQPGGPLPPGGGFPPGEPKLPGGGIPPGGPLPPGGGFPPGEPKLPGGGIPPGGPLPPGGGFPPGGGIPPGGPMPPGGGFPPGGGLPPGGGIPPGGGFQPGGGQPVSQSQPKVVMALLTSNAAALTKLKSNAKLGNEKRIGRYAVYQPANSVGAHVVFPGDRLLLSCNNLTEAELLRLLDQGASNQTPSNDVIRISQSVEQAHAWGALKFNEPIRKQFQALDKMAEQAPELRGMSGALQRAKGASLAVDCLDNGNAWKCRLNIECGSDSDAGEVRKGADGLKGLMSFFLAGAGLPASVTRDLATLGFSNQGVIASASITVTTQSIMDLAKLDGGSKKTDTFPKGKEPLPKSKLLPAPTTQFMQQYVLSNLQDQANDERGIQLNQGQKIEIRAVNNTIGKGPRNNVDFYVFRGDSTDNKNIIAYDQKPLDKDRATGHIAKAQFTVPETGPYYIRVVNRGPGQSTQVIVQIQDITGVVAKETPKEKEKDKQPKFPANAKKAPTQYPVPNMVNGHTDTQVFVFQPGKVVDIRTQFLTPGKQRAEVEIMVLKGETGNEVVARKGGYGPLVILQFTPAGEEAAVYRVRIHNRGPNTALNCAAQVIQQQ